MGSLRLPAIRLEVAAAAFGSFGTLLAAGSIAQLGTDRALYLLVGMAALCTAVLAFVFAPHVAFALTVGWFAILEAVKVQFYPLAGATKDIVVLAAATASLIVFVQRRTTRQEWHVDPPTLVLLILFLALYGLNLGGGLSGESGYGAPWFHGTRLVSEPLILMLAGMVLAGPRRSLHWGLASLVLAACGTALYGLLQQRLGVQGLLDLGYDYGSQVRQIGSRVRSFGTLGEPFAYATFLTFAFAALVLAFRPRPLVWAAGALLAAGLLVSYVRTVALILPAVLGIWLARRGHVRLAVLLIAAAVVAATSVFVVASGERETRLVQASPNTYLTLNGRTNIWKANLGAAPSHWALGRGVGVLGTASERATRTLGGEETRSANRGGGVVDSGYFSTIADVGLIGLALLIGIFGRIFRRAVSAVRRGDDAGWLAIALLTVITLDAITRESFTAFPTAYVSLLLIGIAAAAWTNDPRNPRATEAT